jgi:hypothetical protein
MASAVGHPREHEETAMAQDPKSNAETYDLSRDVVADYEADEGPATGAQHGEDRTRIPEHADRQNHGPKTQAKIKDVINGRSQGGTH